MNHSKVKQAERRQRIDKLPAVFGDSLNEEDRYLLSRPVEALVEDVHEGAHDPIAILTAYGKQALNAHHDTNCLTEVLISDALKWAENCNREGPLAGIPVSVKDVGVHSMPRRGYNVDAYRSARLSALKAMTAVLAIPHG